MEGAVNNETSDGQIIIIIMRMIIIVIMMIIIIVIRIIIIVIMIIGGCCLDAPRIRESQNNYARCPYLRLSLVKVIPAKIRWDSLGPPQFPLHSRIPLRPTVD